MSLSGIEFRTLMDGEISALEQSSFRWPRFSPILERRFEEMTGAMRSRRMWIDGLFCVGLYDAFLFSDLLLFPTNFWHFVVVRLGLVTPPAICAMLYLRRSPKKRKREGVVSFMACFFAISVLYLYFNAGPVISAYGVTDLCLVVLFANLGLRPRFSYAIGISSASAVIGSVFLGLDRWLSGPQKIESLGILLSAVCLSLVANYGIERAERLNFLLRLRSELQTQDLAVVNEHLRQISNEDQLTRISNRRHFEEVYAEVWKSSVAGALAVSLIMIDIDNFKLLNDRYGHSYGDAVLSRVANLLREALRGSGDFVARYGGEEFIIVLPNSGHGAALRVAERIRAMIELAGSPAAHSDLPPNHGWATVSCGVATVFPYKDLNREELIGRADQALYKAKAQGRNCVCSASMQEAQVAEALLLKKG